MALLSIIPSISYMGPMPSPDMSDVKFLPKKRRRGIIPCGLRFYLTVLIIVTIIISIFHILFNPNLSPFPNIHDSDGDGYSDSIDVFPHEPTIWLRMKPVSIGAGYDLLTSYVRPSFIEGAGDLFEGYWISIKSSNGDILQSSIYLNNLISNSSSNGITFFDSTAIGYFNAGDRIIFEKSIYQSGTIITLHLNIIEIGSVTLLYTN